MCEIYGGLEKIYGWIVWFNVDVLYLRSRVMSGI